MTGCLGCLPSPGRSVERGGESSRGDQRAVVLTEHPMLDVGAFVQPREGVQETTRWSSVDVIRRAAGFLLHAAERLCQ
jgi:hypothetical protein